MKKFYVGVGGIIEKYGKFLVLKRSPDKDVGANCWEPVTGRLELEEEPESGVIREIEEETGIKAKVVMPIGSSFFYRGGKEYPMVFIAFWCRYIEGEVKLSWEHSEYRWMTLNEALGELGLINFHQWFKRIIKFKEVLPKDFIL